MPSKTSGSAVGTSGTRSHAPSDPLRIRTSASAALKPNSFALIC